MAPLRVSGASTIQYGRRVCSCARSFAPRAVIVQGIARRVTRNLLPPMPTRAADLPRVTGFRQELRRPFITSADPRGTPRAGRVDKRGLRRDRKRLEDP